MASVQLVAVWVVVLAVLQLAYAIPQGCPTGIATSGKMALEPFFGKKYRMDNCDNLAQVAQLAGTSETDSHIMAEIVEFSLVLNAVGENYTITATGYNKTNPTEVKTKRVPFRFGKEFEIVNGRIESTQISQYGNVLTMVHSGGDPGVVLGIFTPEQLTLMATFKDASITCILKPE